MGQFSLFSKQKDVKAVPACGCNEYSTEFADEIAVDNFTKGVAFRTQGDNLKLTYNGLLARSGAQQVYAVVGYGSNENWKDTRYYPMSSVDKQTFELTLPLKEDESLNVAFKDNAENWDNNAGRNYRFLTH